MDTKNVCLDIDFEFIQENFQFALEFLQQYGDNAMTFNAYRREIERLCQWSWRISQKSILSLKRADIEEYIEFCLDPPLSWIGKQKVHRFLMGNESRIPNPKWRPFVATVNKAQHKQGVIPDKKNYHLSQKAIQEIFTVLSSFYTYCVLSEKISNNPIALIRQKSKYIRKQQTKLTASRLSEIQWEHCLEIAKTLAAENHEKHERTLFIISIMHSMYLRISELVANKRWVPQMGHFYQDNDKRWWFVTVGKGNKERHIPVRDSMLEALARYRIHRKLIPTFPFPGETTPLLHKIIGNGPITSAFPVRQLIQECFDKAIEVLKNKKLLDEANALEYATVHWLRHTGISDDINKHDRPMIHVRDDAGHSSLAITDRYNNSERTERHQSAQNKSI
jgi:site-specific recombinase XerD